MVTDLFCSQTLEQKSILDKVFQKLHFNLSSLQIVQLRVLYSNVKITVLSMEVPCIQEKTQFKHCQEPYKVLQYKNTYNWIISLLNFITAIKTELEVPAMLKDLNNPKLSVINFIIFLEL